MTFAAWIIDWIFVFKVWPDGLSGLEKILHQELAQINQVPLYGSDLAEMAAVTANALYAAIFQATGIHDMGARFADVAALSVPDTIVRRAYFGNFEAIRVAMVATQLFGVRLAILTTAIPFLVLVYGAALADGLVQRAIRRAGGGNESASIYHRAKQLQLMLLAMALAVSLLWPHKIDLRSILLPLSALVAVIGRVQWVYYKKHM